MSQQINLFNPIFRKQKKYFSSVAMAQAMGIICVGCALLVADAVHRTSMLAAQAQASEATLAAKQARLTQVRAEFAPRPRSTTLAAEIAEAQETLAMLEGASATIKRGGFGDTRGFSEYFRAFARQNIEGVWLTSVDIASGGERIGVQGNALQAALVPQYMARLSQEPVMKGKSFGRFDINAAPPPERGMPSYLEFSLQSGAPDSPSVAAAGAAK